jgi:type IV pilus assembly protein PilE
MHPVPSSVARGFTLLELMITVAVIAILASVALPSYSDYVRRGTLPEAFSALADYRVKMEQYYQDHRNYGTSDCADGTPAPTWKTFAPADARYFGFACTLTSSGQGYVLTATGATGAAIGHVYTVDSGNAKRTTKLKNVDVNKGCWASKDGDC